MLAKDKLVAELRKIHLATLQGRSAFRTEASSGIFIQDFTKEHDDEWLFSITGTEEIGGKAVRRPGVGLLAEVRHKVKLRENRDDARTPYNRRHKQPRWGARLVPKGWASEER